MRDLAQFVSRFAIPLFCLALIHTSALHAQTTKPATTNEVNLAYIREQYTKSEHLIAMRDGIKLFTTVYGPKDDTQPYPVLLTRTPYSVRPYSEDRYPDPGGPM